MQFLELVLKNFGPYAGTQTINLRPEKDGNPSPIVLFGGMNGGGKTTLLDAIRLALSRAPRAGEIVVLRALYDQQHKSGGETKAWQAVSAALLNLDETITKG